MAKRAGASGEIERTGTVLARYFQRRVSFVLDLPYDFPRLQNANFEGDRVVFGINRKLTADVQKSLSEADATLYMFLLAAFNILLSKYASQEDLIVGSPVAGRTHPDLHNIPGMFVNTLALRNRPEGEKTFKEFLQEVKETSLQGFAKQDYPLEELIEKLPFFAGYKPESAVQRLFQHAEHGNPDAETRRFADFVLLGAPSHSEV